jgi:site-specific recombinase XerD
MKTIIDSKLLERLHVGPLSPYLDIYLTRVEQEGFLPSSVPCQVYAIARFSRWLERMDISLEGLDESGVQDFLGRDLGVVHHLERSTIRRLVAVLREAGVLRAEQPATLTAIQRHVAEYSLYLRQQRGLAESCLPNYTSFVEKFLSDRFAEGEPFLMSLCSADVTSFITLQVSQLSRGRAKSLVTALHSYLRYLLHRGDITVALAGCIPFCGHVVLCDYAEIIAGWDSATSS